MTSNEKNRIAIIGFGRMAEVAHLPALQKAGWEVVAVVDVTAARQRDARKLGITTVVESVDELIKQDVAIDAALIAAHSSVRRDVALPLIERGVHLFIEKPLATTAAEAEAICDACDDANVKLSVYHNRRFDPDVMMVRAMVRDGRLGRLLSIENRSFAEKPAVEFGAASFNPNWRITQKLGGGTLLDFGPHWIDQVLTLSPELGGVVSVVARIGHHRFGDADDDFLINLVFESGPHALISKTDVCPIAPNYKWLIIGDSGSAIFRDERITFRDFKGAKHTIDQPGDAPNLHANFLEAINSRAELLITGRESLRTVQIIDAARKSAETNASVSVNV